MHSFYCTNLHEYRSGLATLGLYISACNEYIHHYSKTFTSTLSASIPVRPSSSYSWILQKSNICQFQLKSIYLCSLSALVSWRSKFGTIRLDVRIASMDCNIHCNVDFVSNLILNCVITREVMLDPNLIHRVEIWRVNAWPTGNRSVTTKVWSSSSVCVKSGTFTIAATQPIKISTVTGKLF